MTNRYRAHGLQAMFEPGSKRLVLKNQLGIKSVDEMDRMEARALASTMTALIQKYEEQHRFTASDICAIDDQWLGDIYRWAGKYRQVNVSKGDFRFAAAGRIPYLMEQLDREVLAEHTPCHGMTQERVVIALAEVHVELVLIHPFRDGNGRIARALTSLMALQAGLPLLDFSLLAEKRKQDYFAAVRFGLDKNYKPMEELFDEVIERSVMAS